MHMMLAPSASVVAKAREERGHAAEKPAEPDGAPAPPADAPATADAPAAADA